MDLSAKYFGERSASTYERALQHVKDADNKLSRSHIFQHIRLAHRELEYVRNIFRFDIVKQHRSAFYRQLSESIIMKNSKSITLNLKDAYSRCIIPDIKLGERGWREVGPQR